MRRARYRALQIVRRKLVIETPILTAREVHLNHFQLGGTSANFAQDACNPHDVCYNQLGVSKLRCDSEFYGNLLASCEDAFGSFQTYDRNGVPIVNYRAALCKAVADTMKAGIDFPIVSELFFTNAQNNNMCNIWNEAMEENNCSV